MPIIIHKLDASPPARAVLMMAEILKLKYEAFDVDLLESIPLEPENFDTFHRNRMRRIPMIEDGDFVIGDSHGILTYLVSRYGAEKRSELYPGALASRMIIEERLNFESNVLFPVCKSAIKSILFEKASALSDNLVAAINHAYGVLDSYLQETCFVACDHLTLADVSIVSTISSITILLPIDKKYENLISWLDYLKNEDWYQKINVPGLEELKETFKNVWALNRFKCSEK
ncbi:glutathione S-transferase 1-like [Anticarsia gemmatalis]|uniref:glutathione S-transferase 1-like n=1 Tax=Anticarsia gemmatalis TaxID=129554 RepID=UPI003F771846